MFTVWNEEGRAFNVRVVRKGDRFGLGDKLTHDKPDPMIEFYDATQSVEKFGERGQFVSSYYLKTLTDDLRVHTVGLDLMVHVAVWKLDGTALVMAVRGARAELARVEVKLDPVTGPSIVRRHRHPLGEPLREGV